MSCRIPKPRPMQTKSNCKIHGEERLEEPKTCSQRGKAKSKKVTEETQEEVVS